MKLRSTSWLLWLASRLIPRDVAGQYLDEWCAEADSIRLDVGAVSALEYKAHVLIGAPRLGFALRSAHRPFIFDWLIASITLLVPAIFHTVHAGVTGEAVLALLYLLIVAGLALVARSLWTADSGLVGSRSARVGLTLTIIAAISIPVAHRVLSTVTPMSDAPYETWPGGVIATVGAIVLAISSDFRRRVSVVRIGLLLILAGLFLWTSATIANALRAPTWFEWGYHLGIVPSAVVVSVVCFRILRAGAFFVVPEGRVIPHQ